MPSRCCEFVDSRLRRSPPDRASAVPMDKPGKTQCVSPTLPTGRRLPHKLHSTPQQHGMILISGNGEITSRLYAFSLFFPGSCPNNRDRRTPNNLRDALSPAFESKPKQIVGAEWNRLTILVTRNSLNPMRREALTQGLGEP